MKELIEELGLKDLGTSTASESTYINHNLGHASHIDHALIKSHTPASWNPVEVSKEDKVENVANSSTHMPINVSLCIKSIPKRRQPQQQDGTKRYIWKDTDTNRYRTVLDEELETYAPENLDPEYAMKTLLGAIATATTSSMPYKLAHPRKTHGKVRWTPEVSAAV